MIVYNWIISALDCKTKEDNLTDVVYNVHYRYEATKKEITVDTYGSVSVDRPSEEDFIPFNELTKEIIVGWLEQILDVAELQSNLEKQIYLIENPIDVTFNNPF